MEQHHPHTHTHTHTKHTQHTYTIHTHACTYTHTEDMVHRDLKLENILLSTEHSEDEFNVKVNFVVTKCDIHPPKYHIWQSYHSSN